MVLEQQHFSLKQMAGLAVTSTGLTPAVSNLIEYYLGLDWQVHRCRSTAGTGLAVADTASTTLLHIVPAGQAVIHCLIAWVDRLSLQPEECMLHALG